jgi:hypothetical protein
MFQKLVATDLTLAHKLYKYNNNEEWKWLTYKLQSDDFFVCLDINFPRGYAIGAQGLHNVVNSLINIWTYD